MKLVILLFPLFLLLESNSLRGATHLLLKKGDKIKGWKRFLKKKKKRKKRMVSAFLTFANCVCELQPS